MHIVHELRGIHHRHTRVKACHILQLAPHCCRGARAAALIIAAIQRFRRHIKRERLSDLGSNCRHAGVVNAWFLTYDRCA